MKKVKDYFVSKTADKYAREFGVNLESNTEVDNCHKIRKLKQEAKKPGQRQIE